MFGGDASDKKVKVLSGGERSRLAMIRLLLEPVNLLVLDEPTNHLDMRTKDVLKKAIKDFDGTVIIVSHDREFMDGLIEKTYEFGEGKVREHLGGIRYFLEKKKMESLQELEIQTVSNQTETTEKIPSDNKRSYEARKEFNRQIKRLEKKITQCESSIESLEKQVAQTEEKLMTSKSSDNVALQQIHAKVKKELEDNMAEWEKATLELDKLKSNPNS
jgi:ATP-binding cassette subfamily F protein 3